MALRYPGVRTVSEALAVHGLDFVANLIGRGTSGIPLVDAVRDRFPNLLSQSYRALVSRANQSVDLAAAMNAQPEGLTPRPAQHVVNPTLQYPFEYRSQVAFRITYRNGRVRTDVVDVVTRANMPLSADDVRQDVETRLGEIVFDPDYEFRFGRARTIEIDTTRVFRAERNPAA